MKLYTEEQVRLAMDFARGHNKMTDSQFIDLLTPIELPSDEEIEEQSWGYREVTKDMEIPPNEDWSNGAKWIRNKIKGGNNERTN